MAEAKKFSEMTNEEKLAVLTPFERKGCLDCAHVVPAMDMYCGNIAAENARGTNAIGCIGCAYWEPNFDYIDVKYRTAEYGYVSEFDRLYNGMVGMVGTKRWWQFWK